MAEELRGLIKEKTYVFRIKKRCFQKGFFNIVK